MSKRSEVLSLYRRILRIARNWNAKDPKNTESERRYIREEARREFESNRHLICEKEVDEKLNAGVNRVEIALHYGIPFPRPIYFKKGIVPKLRKKQFDGERKTFHFASFTQSALS